jgi:excinuclease ABC subunit B
MSEQGLKCRYMHSDIETLDRVAILRALREGEYDVLIGVNLLREGLDLPEVSLVAIMDADKAGFLRSATSLIQQIGRSARHINATVILYADTVTPAMAQAMDETNRRRVIQLAYNAEHGITPQTIHKEIRRSMELEVKAHQTARAVVAADEQQYTRIELMAELEKQMLEAAQSLEFEHAAQLRDRIRQFKDAPELTGTTIAPAEPPQPAPGTPGTRPIKKRRKTNQRWVKP